MMANKLINEQSLYLQQHAHNPVDWYPWGEAAFEKAKKENKPVIISIGYAACHWCHVMERESFEDEQTAKFMNEHFINIKVDREEYPDVDAFYMDAVQAISSSGGWPLNVFTTADKIPFYGGTYFPPQPAFQRPSWMQLLSKIQNIWEQQPDEIKQQADQMKAFLLNASAINVQNNELSWNKKDGDEIAANILRHADTRFGGFGNAPKFPQTMAIKYLLEHYQYTHTQSSLSQALLSLDKMMQGGLYDQLGGGFARYSTDKEWLAPHFEKMLYDNALLIKLYGTAYQITKQDAYKKVITETVDFLKREMLDDSGLFYCALDADSEGEEGKFYTWTWQEWQAVFPKGEAIMEDYFDVTEKGNWEGTNILHIHQTISFLAEKYHKTEEQIKVHIQQRKQYLFEKRKNRQRPLTDDKTLLSWNALLNIALTHASQSLDKDAYLKEAAQHMKAMLTYYQNSNHLYRVWKGGVGKIDAIMEDYAYLIQALLQLGFATGETSYILKAHQFCNDVMQFFKQENGVLFYTSSKLSENVPIRKTDIYDGALPSANAVMCHNLSLLGILMGNYEWVSLSQKMLHQVYNAVKKHSLSFAYWATQLQRHIRDIKLIVITGKDAVLLQKKIYQKQLPEVYVLTLTKKETILPILKEKQFSDETAIFVCSQSGCMPAVKTIEEIERVL